GEAQHAGTVITTERLLEAMRTAGSTRHVVLAGSCSVYDWTASHGTLSEESPLETMLCERDGYTTAKILQERITRRFADENRWTLSVLRPGFIYGLGAHPASGAGLRLERIFLVVSPFARLRLTHVENCAEAFVNAAEKPIAGTFNIIDDDHVSAWRYAGRLSSRESGSVRIPMPYCLGLAVAYLATIASRILLPAGRRALPGVLNPRQYRARFKPLQYDNRRAKEQLDWKCQPLFETGCDVT
ncbi:MAG: NAD(P)-dependent oxidoreductase, partial [Pseudomonadota bacterium]